MSVFAVALARVLRHGDLLEVAGDHCDGGEHADNGETDAEPPVENLRNHAVSLARPASLPDIAIPVEVFVETQLDSGKQARRHFVVVALFADDRP